ncbi:nitroreductase [Saonia flava]|uniref:Nitroreductase n=1 Tax=Saonia flava TaxID=523696 RepID=A0A846QYB8_9FLAO|nr:nitroreductase family protein [Saonia flava]NJB70114.1 nitroreductase [Saonia flava]
MIDSIKDLEWRYAVKKFDSKKELPASKIEKLKEAFNLTATSYGLQPIRLVVLQNKGLQKELVASSFDQAQVYQASHVLIICIEEKIDKNYIINYFERVKEVRGTSDEILDPFKERMIESFSSQSPKEIREWAVNQAHLAMGNLLTICAIERIDACPMAGFVPSAYDELLGLRNKGLQSVLVMPVGYRAPDDMFSEFKKVRKDINDSVIEIS